MRMAGDETPARRQAHSASPSRANTVLPSTVMWSEAMVERISGPRVAPSNGFSLRTFG